MALLCPQCKSQKLHYTSQTITNIDGKAEKNLFTIECEQGHHLGIAELRDIDKNKPSKPANGIMQGIKQAQKGQPKSQVKPSSIQQKEQPPTYIPVDNGSYGAAKNNQNQVSNTDEPATPLEDPESSDPEADQSLE